MAGENLFTDDHEYRRIAKDAGDARKLARGILFTAGEMPLQDYLRGVALLFSPQELQTGGDTDKAMPIIDALAEDRQIEYYSAETGGEVVGMVRITDSGRTVIKTGNDPARGNFEDSDY